MKGFVCVLYYITESKVNTGAAMWIPFVTVTNTLRPGGNPHSP
jgi:tRNA G18 (ribose-2'-O)-methylase SpoU